MSDYKLTIEFDSLIINFKKIIRDDDEFIIQLVIENKTNNENILKLAINTLMDDVFNVLFVDNNHRVDISDNIVNIRITIFDETYEYIERVVDDIENVIRNGLSLINIK